MLTFGNRVNSPKTLGVSEPSRCRWKALEWLSRASKAPFPEARGTWLATSFPLQLPKAFALTQGGPGVTSRVLRRKWRWGYK